ncbi:MAG: SDR family oxidoreductase, partial [Pseudomonadota bacterium]
MGRLKDKTCLVAAFDTSGVGRACAAMFRAEGAEALIASDREGDGVAATINPTDEGEWMRLREEAGRRSPRLDALVISPPHAPDGAMTEVDAEAFKSAVDRSVVSAFLAMKTFIPLMRDGGGGSIVAIAPELALGPAAKSFAGSALAGALQLFTKSVALECARSRMGVRVNSLHADSVVNGASADDVAAAAVY